VIFIEEQSKKILGRVHYHVRCCPYPPPPPDQDVMICVFQITNEFMYTVSFYLKFETGLV